MKKHSQLYIPAVLFISMVIFCSGCTKLIEVDPPIDIIVGKEIYKTDATAASVLTGMFIDMSNNGIFTGVNSISLITGLSADELVSTTIPSNKLNIVFTNSLTNQGDELQFWTDLYAFAYRTNSTIEGVSASTGLTPAVKNQLLGEAKFLRAFMYFYLVNLYGDVPLLTSTDVNINNKPTRTSKEKVYDQIIKDLKEAQEQLSDNYVSAKITGTTSERARPNKSVATALLARAYLYTDQWALAEEESNELITNEAVYQLENLDKVFLSTSREAIWQLQPVDVSRNTYDAVVFVLAAGPNDSPPAGPDEQQFGRPVYLSPHIYNVFENEDMRKAIWIDSVTVSGITYPYAYKYKVWQRDEPLTEYLMVMRLAEQYLIRAEARAQQNKLTGANSAKADVDTLRSRAGLSASSASTQPELLNAILNERKKELFTEWGHRWFDLKRTQKIDDVMVNVASTKNAVWESYKALYPIPVRDIQLNPNLKGSQNPGYPEN